MAIVVYTVQPGDTLWKIAKQFRVTVPEIAAQNQISNADRIYPGQRLRITVPPRYDYYVVRPGDTLGDIAKRFQTTVEDLAKRNGIRNVNRIYAGQILKIR
jgi:LysM repeat protein